MSAGWWHARLCLFSASPPPGLILVDWLHLQVANMTTAWGCVADSIHRSADETVACAAGGEEIRARIQHEQMRRARRSACCNWVAALLQQHCSPCVQSKVCAYLPPPGEPVLICHCAPVRFHVRICCGYAPIANNGAGNEWPQVDCDCQGGCCGAAC